MILAAGKGTSSDATASSKAAPASTLASWETTPGRGMAFVVDDARERREWNEDQEVLMEFLRSQMLDAK